MESSKKERMFEISSAAFVERDLSIQKLADKYEVSTKSATRSINELKMFLANHQDMVGNTE